jgi:hypothetical protein
MREPDGPQPTPGPHPPPDEIEFETVRTTPADIESAGRSCMAIIILAAVILLVLVVGIAVRIVATGQ